MDAKILELSKLPQLSKEDVLKLTVQDIDAIEDINQLHQIAESASNIAESDAEQVNNRKFEIKVTQETKDLAKSMHELLHEATYSINSKIAMSLVEADKFAVELLNAPGKTFEVTGLQYNHILFALSTEFTGSINVALKLVAIFKLFEDISRQIEASQKELQQLHFIYNHVADIVEKRHTTEVETK